MAHTHAYVGFSKQEFPWLWLEVPATQGIISYHKHICKAPYAEL